MGVELIVGQTNQEVIEVHPTVPSPPGPVGPKGDTGEGLESHLVDTDPHTQYARKGAANTLTGSLTIETSSSPLRVVNPSAASGSRSWNHSIDTTTGALQIVPTADNGAFPVAGDRFFFFRDRRLRFGSADVIHGTGMPNGVVSAPVGSRYSDIAATNGAIEWIKAAGSGNTGWQVAHGDTGWRNMNAFGAEDSGLTNHLTFTSNWSWHTTSGSRFAIRRVNERVYLMFVGNIRATASTMNGPVFNENTPLGFRASYTMVPFRGGANGTTGYFGMFSPNGPFLADAPTAGFSFGYSQGSFVTTDPWPTTLPGTAA